MNSQNPHDEFFRVTLLHVGTAKDLLFRQNYGHVQAIKNYLRDNELNTYSIIAFSPSVEFKFKEPFKTAKVVHFNELITVIKEQSIPVVNAEKLQKIQQEIDRLVLADPKEKRRIQKEHVKQVAGKQRESGKM